MITSTASFGYVPVYSDSTRFKFWRFLEQDGVYPRLLEMTPELKELIEQELLGAVITVRIRVEDVDMVTGIRTREIATEVDQHTRERLNRVRALLIAADHGSRAAAAAEEASAPPTPIEVPAVKLSDF